VQSGALGGRSTRPSSPGDKVLRAAWALAAQEELQSLEPAALCQRSPGVSDQGLEMKAATFFFIPFLSLEFAWKGCQWPPHPNLQMCGWWWWGWLAGGNITEKAEGLGSWPRTGAGAAARMAPGASLVSAQPAWGAVGLGAGFGGQQCVK